MSSDHTAYIETLAHVNCGECDGYWGLSDLKQSEIAAKEWSCPHCGQTSEIGSFEES